MCSVEWHTLLQQPVCPVEWANSWQNIPQVMVVNVLNSIVLRTSGNGLALDVVAVHAVDTLRSNDQGRWRCARLEVCDDWCPVRHHAWLIYLQIYHEWAVIRGSFVGAQITVQKFLFLLSRILFGTIQQQNNAQANQEAEQRNLGWRLGCGREHGMKMITMIVVMTLLEFMCRLYRASIGYLHMWETVPWRV